MDPIRALVFRFDPEKDEEPRYARYDVEIAEETCVLALLDRIQREMDPTLSFRSYCCGLQSCGSCRVRINKKRKFACITTVKPGDEVTIDPLTFPEDHIKDLVVQVK
jgi:succinate dehydrogenase/fumarate reductase-like Fe-S protein